MLHYKNILLNTIISSDYSSLSSWSLFFSSLRSNTTIQEEKPEITYSVPKRPRNLRSLSHCSRKRTSRSFKRNSLAELLSKKEMHTVLYTRGRRCCICGSKWNSRPTFILGVFCFLQKLLALRSESYWHFTSKCILIKFSNIFVPEYMQTQF